MAKKRKRQTAKNKFQRSYQTYINLLNKKYFNHNDLLQLELLEDNISRDFLKRLKNGST
jgi:hypothetical protein